MRFHFGFSFGFKQIKKYILPILLGILAYFGLSSFGLINVYAEENFDTYYNFNYGEEDFENMMLNSDYNFQEVFDTFVDYDSPYYNIIITYSHDYIYVYCIPKSISSFSSAFYAFNSGSDGIVPYFDAPITYGSSYYFIFNKNTTNTYFNYLRNCLDNNVCTKLASPYSMLFEFYPHMYIDNNSSYTFDSSKIDGQFLYYSQVPLIYRKTTPRNNINTPFYKSVKFNDILLNDYDEIPTYLDTYPKAPSKPPNKYDSVTFNEFGDLFISNIPKDNLNKLRVDFSFDFYDQNFVKDLRFQTLLYGRKNNGTYYSYEFLEDCNIYSTSSYGDTTYDIVFNDLKCSSDLSNYDNIHIKIRPYNYDHNSSTFIRNFTYKTNYGYIENISNGPNYYTIMEHFNTLPGDFNILLSTTKEIAYASVNSYNPFFVLMSPYYYNEKKLCGVGYDKLDHFGKEDSTSLMVYNHKPSNDGPTNHLSIFFSSDVILSYNKNTSFTHYDKDNNIVSSDIVNNYQSIVQNTYDGFSNLGGISSLLPSGPIDSLLSIPINFLNRSINALNGTCSPFKTKYVFNQELEIPCFGEYYESFPAASKILLDTIPSAILLVAYFKHLYKKVDRATSLQANSDDDWGVL